MDFDSESPIYMQIARRMSNEILVGKYGDEGRLPSVRDYASLMEVNPATAVRAYALLEQKGVIVQRRGLGYFVTKDSGEMIQKTRREEFFEKRLPRIFREIDLLGINLEEIEEKYRRYCETKRKGE